MGGGKIVPVYGQKKRVTKWRSNYKAGYEIPGRFFDSPGKKLHRDQFFSNKQGCGVNISFLEEDKL